jgi:hypothetical protein
MLPPERKERALPEENEHRSKKQISNEDLT